MGRIKGRYVAMVVIDVDTDESMPFDVIHDMITGGVMKKMIQDRLSKELAVVPGARIEVEQMLADAYELDDLVDDDNGAR